MASQPKGTLYIGVTSNLEKRVYEHRHSMIDGFTKRYDIKQLVYVEETPDMASAIAREKQLKNWHRDWKINLIQQHNPKWLDLAADWFIEACHPELGSGPTQPRTSQKNGMDAETGSA